MRLWGFALGLPSAGIQVALMARGIPAGSWLKVAESSAYALGVAPLALVYAATFAILWQSASWRARLTRLAPAGRIALMNYLSQTVVALMLFYGIALDLMGHVSPTSWPLLVFTVLTAQVLSAHGSWHASRSAPCNAFDAMPLTHRAFPSAAPQQQLVCYLTIRWKPGSK